MSKYDFRLPEASAGAARIEHFEFLEGEVPLSAMRQKIPAGRYCRLVVDGQLWMSDTPMELQTNTRIRRHAVGRVLIAGLGMGLVLPDVLRRRKVASVDVIEKHADVIALMSPMLQHPKLTITQGDIFKFRPRKGQQWDTIYFDVWPDIASENLKDMARLYKRFRPCFHAATEGAWMGSWNEDECLIQKARELILEEEISKRRKVFLRRFASCS